MKPVFLVPLLLALQSGVTAQGTSSIVISQIYGGGGNAGATLTNDFVELFNRGETAIDLTGWSIQYASATGSSWARTVLSGKVEPGQYYLIQQARGAGGILPLPRPDLTGTITISATAGKLALSRTSILFSTVAPVGPDVVDFVAFGSTNASLSAPSAELSNTTAAIRRDAGCTDTRNNSADFTVLVPSPRNTASPRNMCGRTNAPRITSVLNTASRIAGAIAPGMILTIKGQGLGPDRPADGQQTADGNFITKFLEGSRFLFDGLPAPILRTSATSAEVIVPFGVAGRPQTILQVEYRNHLSEGTELSVVDAVPAIFTLHESGADQAMAWNSDNAPNSERSPASRGSIITLLASGCGPASPILEDGRIVRGEPPNVTIPLVILIGGIKAEVISATAMPGYPAGFVRLTAKVPELLDYGGPIPVAFQLGESISQYGVTISVEGVASEPGTGDAVESSLVRLRTSATDPPLAEITDDRSLLPRERLGIVTWNVQTGGTSVEPDAPRPPMVKSALQTLFAGSYQILVGQEISNQESAELLRSLLPGGREVWHASFEDTPDLMDNGVWYRNDVTIRSSFALFANGELDSTGKLRAAHPPWVATVEAGDFDFTLISVHLTYADGDARESRRELGHVLDYLDRYFAEPGHDPDVLVCGDFNLPSRRSEDREVPHGIYLEDAFDNDPRFQRGERRFAVTVSQPTSRRTRENGGVPNRNLDHCVVSADALEELVQVRRVDPDILFGHPEDPEERLTSDHFPIAGVFRMRGERVARDHGAAIRP